jgi:hypothetical protein
MTVPAADPAAPIPVRGEGAGVPGVRGFRPAGLAGAGFAAVTVASVLIEGWRRGMFATGRQVTAFFQGHASQMRGAIAAFLLIPAVLFVWFRAVLASPPRAAGRAGGQLPIAVAAGGGFVVAFLMLAKLIDNITAASLAFSHTYWIDPQEARLTAGLAYWVQAASMAGAYALLVAASILARRARMIAAWAAVAGYLLAAAAPASVALNGVPNLLFFACTVAAGVLLAQPTAAPHPNPVFEQRSSANGQ